MYAHSTVSSIRAVVIYALYARTLTWLTQSSAVDGGFCDEDLTTNDMFGTYLWPETAVEETRQLPCNFSGPNENPSAKRTCVSQSVWGRNPDYDECYTFITMMYNNFNAVSLLTPIGACVLHTCGLL